MQRNWRDSIIQYNTYMASIKQIGSLFEILVVRESTRIVLVCTISDEKYKNHVSLLPHVVICKFVVIYSCPA